MRSIRHQLLRNLVGGTLLCCMVAGAALYKQVFDEASEESDMLLLHIAKALPQRLTALPTEANELDDEIVVQLWSARVGLLYSSQPALPLTVVERAGFQTVDVAGVGWRVFKEVRSDGVVQVAQPMDERRELAGSRALRLLLPVLALLGVLGAFIFVAVGRALLPLEVLAQRVANNSALAPTAVDLPDAPPELVPIVGALNDLLARIDAAMRAQRHFTADAAHELRSPLAAVKLQLQLAERAENDEQRDAAFGKLHLRLDRATRLINQLLTLARHEPDGGALPAGPVDLLELARGIVAEQSARAEEKGIDLGVAEVTGPVRVQGDTDALGILLNNLVDNALRYTQAGGRVDVALVQDQDGVRLCVSDDGPGVAEDLRGRLGDRFFRVEGNASPGCGLGLSIVGSIARRHGASMYITAGSGGRGLTVSVLFPHPPHLAASLTAA